METNSYTSNSKGRRFIWLKLILFMIILYIVLNKIGQYYERLSGENKISTDYKKAWNEFYKLEPNTLDLIFIGSSHSYCSFSPEIMDDETGSNSFNFGSPLQHPDSSYYILKEVLKYHKPKVMVYEIYWDMIKDDFELKQADTVITAIDRKQFETDFTKNVFPLNELIKYRLKPIRFQQDVFNYWNKQIKENIESKLPMEKDQENNIKGVSYHKYRGFIYSDIIIPESEYYETNQFVGFNGANWSFSQIQKSYIEKMVLLCRKEGIQPIFITAPIANISMEYIDNYDIIHEKISKFSKELNVPYRDYNMINMENNLFINENFRDDAHLNFSGVEILMQDFIKWYKKEQILE